MQDYWHLWLGALFLKRESYEYQHERKDSFAHGLLFIVLIGVVVALSGIVGAGLRFGTEPKADAIKNVVLNHIENMPFYEQMPPATQRGVLDGYNRVWARFGGLFVGYPINGQEIALLLFSLVTTPLIWILGWLLYGVLAHLVASRGSPEASLGHGLGTLALAASPQLLNVFGAIPGASVSGLVVGLWTLVCNFSAIRTAYRAQVRTALWATLFPLLLLMIVLLLLVCITVALFVTIAGRSSS